MNPIHMMSIHAEWNEKGQISFTHTTNLRLTDYQYQDGLALSVPLLVSSQLGVLIPVHTLRLCERLLDFLVQGDQTIEPINKELKAARTDLLKKGNTIVQTFHPRMGFFAGKGGEEGVRQFLNNYVGHVYNSVSADLPNFMRATLLTSIYFYLVEVLTKATGGQRFDPTRTNMQVQMTMLTFTETIFPRWGGNLSEERFQVLLSDSKDTLRNQKYLAGL